MNVLKFLFSFTTAVVAGILLALFKPWSFGQKPYLGLSEQFLRSALSRAPAECSQKFHDLFHRQMTGQLKLDYTPDPMSLSRCNASLLKIPKAGSDKGKIMQHPTELRSLLPAHSERKSNSNSSGDSVELYSLAFMILMHGDQTTAVIDRLVSALHRPHHRILIHMDSKAPKLLHARVAALANRSPGSIAVLQPSRAVSWGGPSMLQVRAAQSARGAAYDDAVPRQVELEGLAKLVDWGGGWGHVLVLSGRLGCAVNPAAGAWGGRAQPGHGWQAARPRGDWVAEVQVRGCDESRARDVSGHGRPGRNGHRITLDWTGRRAAQAGPGAQVQAGGRSQRRPRGRQRLPGEDGGAHGGPGGARRARRRPPRR